MPGSKPHSLTANAVLGLMVGLQAYAVEPARTAVPQTDGASMSLLEYLGEWDQPQGGWQDPMEFADPQWEPLIEEAKRQHEYD